MNSTRDDIKKNIINEINSIDTQIASLLNKKHELLKKLSALPSPTQTIVKDSSFSQQLSNNEKIQLFRSLFKGREDAYARLWISKKTGKSGYSPVCKNEWAAGICKKPIIKCAECSNRKLVGLSDEIIRDHLIGKCVTGIYPMLKDETCCFLAVDFDGSEGNLVWEEDVKAFRKTCLEENIPVAIERSRSGNGAHAWIFFQEEISASVARKMGSFLITKTMSQRYQLDMKSYDRLFPNQDTLPKGGFGNLIALPFQKEAVGKSNSVFIDEEFNPYKDQWGFLLSVERMSVEEIDRIAKEASRNGQITGVRMSPTYEDDPPWMRLPSGRRKYKAVISDLPECIEIVLANKIYIKTENVSSILLNQFKQLAAFQNPEFYRRQSMRLSTFSTPRIICCAEFLDGYLCLPRGCLEDICLVLNEYSVNFNVKDERCAGKRTKFKFSGKLTKEQQLSLRKICKHDTGVFSAPPGTGKTVLAINAIAKRKTNTLILVHRKPLLEQWKLQLSAFLGIDPKSIGHIGGGKNKSNGMLDIAMVQSMERKGIIDDRIADYGFVIVDECHHISAVSFERVLAQAKAKYILGLTATPYRRDGHQPIIHMQCGSIVHQINPKEAISHSLQPTVIPQITTFSYDWSEESNIYDLWPTLISDEKRNELIVDDVGEALAEGRFPIILTERREHLEKLELMLKNVVKHLVVLYGGMGIKRRREVMEYLRANADNGNIVILATGAYIGEGFDEVRLDTLFIAMPISFKGKVVQYAGRLHRKHHNKKSIRIYDYVDEGCSVLARMYERRLKTYKALGYAIDSMA
ncbi:MAG: DEAD/DEAH box helicase [Candidatus Omnitrophica bacterium]|nr:DEAD/DEAH box helicase [Candidatus Omnitrophota bacterium]